MMRRLFCAAIALAITGLIAVAAEPAAAETFGAKLRRLAAAADRSNPLKNPPLLPAPAWARNQSYAAGEAVANEGNLYLCYSGGISGSAGGPTGAGYANIRDGSVVWVYDGPVVVRDPDPAAPVLSSTAATSTLTALGLTNYVNPVEQPSRFALGGGVPTARNGTQLAIPAVKAVLSGVGGNVGLNNGASNYQWSATFQTDAPRVAIGVGDGGMPAAIIIDGRRLSPGGFKGVAAASPSWLILDFASAGGREARTITIRDYGNVSFAGARVDPDSTVSPPPATDRVRVAFFGSSVEAGGNGFPVLNAGAWPQRAADLLGWSDPWNLGVGATGYIANASGKSPDYLGHVSDAVDISPDIVVIGGANNDAGNPPAAVTAAVMRFIRTLRAALPHAPVIAMGTFPASSGPSAAVLANENAVLAAVQALRDPLVFFVPVSSGAFGPVITGKGRSTAPSGKGNADFYISPDGGHPNQQGINYQAVQYAARIRSVFVDALP
jgi:hypothetical protein